jgi:amino acid transporter
MVFCVLTVILYTSSPNAVSFGRYLLYVCGDMNDGWGARGVAVAVMTIVSLIHTFAPIAGRVLMKWLGVAKIVMLAAMIIMGFLCLGGALKPEGNPKANFKNAFSPPLTQCQYNKTLAATPACKGGGPKQEAADPAGFALALMNIIFAFSGWNSANMVLGEIKDPNRSMKLAGIASIGIVTLVYILANIALFSVIPAAEIGEGNLLITGVMFERATNRPEAARAAAAFIALSNLGNVFSFSFSMARLVQEYARSKMLPRWFAWTFRGSPGGGVRYLTSD